MDAALKPGLNKKIWEWNLKHMELKCHRKYLDVLKINISKVYKFVIQHMLYLRYTREEC